MNPVAVGTIVAKNYLSFARVLRRSLREHHPELPFFVILADQVEGAFDPAAEPFEIVPLEALAIPDLRRVCFRYSRQQVTIVAKPYLLRYLLNRGFAAAIFLDADTLVVGRLDPLLTASEQHSIVLTSHLLGPLAGVERITRELNILQSGVYNGGFVGVSNTVTARRFLGWWADRMDTHCRHAVAEGMHYDQRWLDLAPAFFEDLCIMRDAGCNVAYWNLPERDLQIRLDAVLVDGSPCRFFHFSGFDPDDPSVVTRYARHLRLETVGPAAALFERYVRLLEEDRYCTTKSWPYAFGCFDNGVPIPDVARLVYSEMHDVADSFGNPFQATRRDSYFHWLNEPAGESGGSARGVTRLWEAVHRSRPDLQQGFPDILNGDSDAFCEWVVRHGRGEYSISDAFIPRR